MSDLSSALDDAIHMTALALEASPARTRIIRSLESLAAAPHLGANLPTCGHLTVAAHALAELPDDPATRPDRDSISLVVSLVAETIGRDAH